MADSETTSDSPKELALDFETPNTTTSVYDDQITRCMEIPCQPKEN